MLASLVLAVALQYRQEYPLPGPTVPSGLGVNVHIIVPQDDSISKIAEAGFKWIRMDMMWNEIEHHKGQYDFSRYDQLNAQVRANHLRALYILDYGNDIYQQGAPRSPEAIQGFVNFVHAALRHYRHQGVVWEMYNEPNIHFWQPTPNVQEYVALAAAVGQEIRTNEPDEYFVGPGMSGMDWSFISACMNGGLLNYWDAVSVHPYREDTPETVNADWQKLKAMIAAQTPGRHIGLVCSEWGYSGLTVGNEAQAAYVVREYLENLADGAPLTIWYDWSDDVDNKRADERHFGIVAADLSPKQTLDAVQAMVKELGGWRFIRRLPADDPVELLVFRKGSETKIVGWSQGDSATTTLMLAPGAYKQAPLGGEPVDFQAGNSGAQVRLQPMPCVIQKA